MRLNLFVTCIAICTVVIATTFMLTFCIKQGSLSEAESAAKSTAEVPKASASAQYMLKEYQGRLAVFFYGDTVPQKVFDVYVSTLPEYDRGQLSQGVAVQDYAELVRRIEDYIS